MEVLEGTFVVSVITAPVLLFIISTLPCSTTKSGHGSEALRDTSAEAGLLTEELNATAR